MIGKIGQGGMGQVYLAQDLHLKKNWAVKAAGRSAGSAAAGSILREAFLMKSLDHPALPRVVDILEEPERICLIMDYIRGKSLSDLLAEKGPLPEREAYRFAVQIADMLAYLHSRKPPVVYRDMKPSNIILTDKGQLKLIDFGIAKLCAGEEADEDGFGTRKYAPPEQIRNTGTDARSDIYSFGMTLRELTGGRKGNRSGRLERVIRRCIESDPGRRYPDLRALQRDLRRIRIPGSGRRVFRSRKMLIRALIPAALSAGIAAGAGVRAARADRYETLIRKETPQPERQLMQAALLDPDRPEAYRKLLDWYCRDGKFTGKEYEKFRRIYAQKRRKDLRSISYYAGLACFYHYSGGDGTLRCRALKSEPYFREAKGYQSAGQYCFFCSFYRSYVMNQYGVREAGEGEYRSLFSAIDVTMRILDGKRSRDSDYLDLLTEKEMVNLLNQFRRGLKSAGVGKREVMRLAERIEKSAGRRKGSRSEIIRLKQEIAESCSEYEKNIGNLYWEEEF